MNEKDVIHSFFNHRTGILATMHHKEKVISPVVEEKLGIPVEVPLQFDTDQFGTFTGDIDRTGNQLEAAKLKAERGMLLSGKTIGIASEGIFGPHPYIPWIPYNREIIFLMDKENKFEIFGEATTTVTNYNHTMIKNHQEANDFCETVGFPDHAVIIRKDNEIIKGINSKDHLVEAIEYMLKKCSTKELMIETDMRALFNPTRMNTIKSATLNLISKIYSLCSKCSYPGLEVVERKKGLLCSDCGLKTELIKSEIYKCRNCGELEEKLYPNGKQFADPSNCPFCNP